MPKTILITGGAGFVGSSLAIRFKKNYPAYKIIALDNLKRRGSELNLNRLKEAGIEFFHGDIRNQEDFNSLPAVDLIIEASAEPSVLAGMNEPPSYVVNTNLLGTVNCLNFAVKNKSDFIFLSTSRVYPIEKIEKIEFRRNRHQICNFRESVFNRCLENRHQRGFPPRRLSFIVWRDKTLFGTFNPGIQSVLRSQNSNQSLRRFDGRVADGQSRSGSCCTVDGAAFLAAEIRIFRLRRNRANRCATFCTSMISIV